MATRGNRRGSPASTDTEANSFFAYPIVGKDPSDPGSSNDRSSQELKVPFFERPLSRSRGYFLRNVQTADPVKAWPGHRPRYLLRAISSIYYYV